MSCPICDKESDPKYRPFCSRRCADVDLGRWLTGSYRVAADSPEELDDAAAALAQEAEKPHSSCTDNFDHFPLDTGRARH